jgi:prepilin-type N-terminal cleavage/methylation domain-containing protein
MHTLSRSPKGMWPARGPAVRRKATRGFTMIELLMAAAILSVGITGIAAIQTATTASNRHAKNLALASSLARAWQEELAIDALRWTDSTIPTLPSTVWLNTGLANDGQWLVPAASGTFGPSFDALGNFTAASADTVFCTHVRTTRLLQAPGSGLVRIEVRVFWPKHGHGWEGGATYCAPGTAALFRPFNPAVATATSTEVDNFHFVYTATAVRQTPSL